MAKRKMAHAAKTYVTRHDLKRLNQGASLTWKLFGQAGNRSTQNRLMTLHSWLIVTAEQVERALKAAK